MFKYLVVEGSRLPLCHGLIVPRGRLLDHLGLHAVKDPAQGLRFREDPHSIKEALDSDLHDLLVAAHLRHLGCRGVLLIFIRPQNLVECVLDRRLRL